jgi:pilus assembly protein Flp/PilA
MNLVKRLILRAKEVRGQGMAEYAMILALVAVVAVAALTPLGSGIASTLNSVVSSL